MSKMNSYLLRPREDLPDNESENPWVKWYNKAFGFVIIAENESKARKIAQKNGGDEIRQGGIWTKEKYTTCIPLEEYESENEVVMRDYARG